MDHNPYGLIAMWAQSDWVIKGVALLLLSMSIASWYIMLTRIIRLLQIKQHAHTVEKFWHAHRFTEGLSQLEQPLGNPFHALARDAQTAVQHHHNNHDDLQGQISLANWLSEALRGAIDDTTEKLQSGLSILASVGSTAPFVGLFGTVWGIYHALVAIGASGQASIDKVAGPVGESLIMTAFGLAVAIPAVLGYNTLTRGNKNLRSKLNRFARQLHAYFLTGSPLKNQGQENEHAIG
jgi:biopolymer transport protein ExbB